MIFYVALMEGLSLPKRGGGCLGVDSVTCVITARELRPE